MPRALKSLRTVQMVLLVSILLYGVVGQFAGPSGRIVNPNINYLFSTLSVAIVGIIFVVRRTMVFRAEQTLATQPDDSISLSHWKTGYIATYSLCEALALFGLVLKILGCNWQQCIPFYLGGFVLLLFFRVKQPVSAPAA
jgi:hypothetical protein